VQAKTKKILVISLITLLIVGVVAALTLFATRPGKYDTFAKCLKEKGAKFYGAFWCPHCANQKKLFGSSAKYLDYIECSTPDAKKQVQLCIDKKIQGYPTWIFSDGSILNGEVKLEKLAEKTGCSLPKE
jgi:hypothetical protein